LWEPQLEYYGLNFLCLQSTNTPRPFFKPKFWSHKPRKFQTNIVSLNFRTRQMEPPLVYGNLCAKKLMSQTTLSVETSCTHTLSTFAWLCVCMYVCVCVCVCFSLYIYLSLCLSLSLSLSLLRIVFSMHLFQDMYMKFKSHQWLGHFTYWLTYFVLVFFWHSSRGLILFYGHILLGSCLPKGTVFQKWAPDLKLEGQGVSQSEGLEAALQIEGLPWTLPSKLKVWTKTYPLQNYAKLCRKKFQD
jgi:hypothetical protein